MTRWRRLALAVALATGCGVREVREVVYVCERNGYETRDPRRCAPPTEADILAKRERRAAEARRAGDTLYDLGNWPRALAWYVESYAWVQTPMVLFRAGQAARNADQRSAALWFYRAYLLRSFAGAEENQRAMAREWMKELDHVTLENNPVWSGHDVRRSECQNKVIDATRALLADELKRIK